LKLIIKNINILLIALLLFPIQAFSINKSNQMQFKIKTIPTSNRKPIFITIPFPKGYFFSQQKLSLLWDNSPIPFSANAHLLWPSITRNKREVRAITIKLPIGLNGSYTLIWDNNKGKPLSSVNLSLLASQFHDIELPTNWLRKLSYAPVLPDKSNYKLKWFDESFEKHGLYIINKQEIKKSKHYKNYSLNQTSQWLYDRVFSLYQLYFKTGNLKWKKEAHKAAIFYKSNIGLNGYFKLKQKKDIKYLLGTGILYDHLFYPDKNTPKIINKMYQNTLSWPAKYSLRKGFWTERNLSNAYNIAITQWEITNDHKALNRVYDLLNGIKEHLNISPEIQANCLLHKLSQHEGKKDDVLVCSPWMTALLGEQLWRFYYITNNKAAAQIIMDFANFILKKTIYKGHGVHLKNYLVADYLTFFGDSKYKERNQWDDIQHACDLSGLLAKAEYLKKASNINYKKSTSLLDDFLKTCKKTAYHPSSKARLWKLSPLRKFNWWFGSTANLTWLYEEIR